MSVSEWITVIAAVVAVFFAVVTFVNEYRTRRAGQHVPGSTNEEDTR